LQKEEIVTSSDLAKEVFALVEAKVLRRASPVEFEMAYQARTACDRIRFAIRSTEQFSSHSAQVREANLQLLDALDRLESADRQFQSRFRAGRTTLSEVDVPLNKNGNADNKSHQELCDGQPASRR
jgi:hypothetical protein